VSGTITPSSTVTPSAEAVEAAVRAYFDAFNSSDFAALESRSVGELTVLPRWLRTLSKEASGLGVLTVAGASVDSLKVTSIAGRTAAVRIRGQLAETAFDERTKTGKLINSDISGPVTVVRSGTTWQVADFRRAGRSVRDQIFTVVRGQQTSQGITVTITGVDLSPTGTILALDVRDTTLLPAGAANPAIQDAAGRLHRTSLGDTVVLEVNRRSTARHALFFPGGLRPGTTMLRFRADFNLGCNPVCKITTSFDLPIQVVR
jgi:hypothetical protein